MPELILHIGTEKTGTSSIQSFLSLNRSRLQRHGILVPEFLGKTNQFKIVFLAYPNGRRDDLTSGILLDSQLKREKNRIREWLETRSRSSHFNRWIISSEHCHSRLTSPKEIDLFLDTLSQYFSKIKVIVYMRNPISMAVSLFSTAIKCGRIDKSFFPVDDPHINVLCDHESTLRKWNSGHFPNVELVPRIYSPGCFLNGDLITDFRSVAEIENLDLLPQKQRDNKSLSFLGMKVLTELNVVIPYFVDGKFNPARHGLVEFVESSFAGGARFAPGREVVQEFRERFEGAVRVVADLRPGVLEEWEKIYRDFSELDGQTLGLLENERQMISAISALWLKMQEGRVSQ